MTHDTLKDSGQSRKLAESSEWLATKMIDEGCTLEQTLQFMEERCKTCNIVSPMICVEQCETWQVKRELRKTSRKISSATHKLAMLNAIKNDRRQAVLEILRQRPLSVEGLQRKLRELGFSHSKKTINQYLKPLLATNMIKEQSAHFVMTLYGRRIHEAINKHSFRGNLPIHSFGYEEELLKKLLEGPKTHRELAEIAPVHSVSRVLRRLKERGLISDNSLRDHVFYFRTRRPLSLERLSPTQKRISELIPQAGTSARDLSKIASISLRRTYKYLRNLRGKKLVFRRNTPVKYMLTSEGKPTAEFLEEIAMIA